MILVWNVGSSSIKYFMFDESLALRTSGSFTGLDINNMNDFLVHARKAISQILSFGEAITIIAFRIVSAGRNVNDGDTIDEELILKIEHESERILHNKAVLAVAKSSLVSFPNVDHKAYFDTTYFNNLPGEAKKYALSDKLSRDLGVDRLGFHGISHRWAMNFSENSNKVISIHLGAGCSVAAINCGKPVDVSMGHSTNEGLVMRTRSGDLDSMLVLEIAEKYGISETRELLQKESGLRGMTGLSGDMLDVLDMAGCPIEDMDFVQKKSYSRVQRVKAQDALKLYIYRIKKFIGAYAALMNGVDAIIFTGKIGAGSAYLRKEILSNTEYLGAIKTIVVQPDEELAIAKLVQSGKKS